MSISRYEIRVDNESLLPQLRYITYSRYDNEWLSVVHSHSILEMLYIISGDGQIVIGSEQRDIRENQFVIIPPHLMHTEISSKDRPLEYLCLGISNITVLSADESFDPVADLGNSRDDVFSLIRNIYREMQRKQGGYEMMARSCFYRLMVLLIRNRVLEMGVSEEKLIRSNIADAKEYIDIHYAEQFSLDTLASVANLSKYHLIREFSSAVGSSPMEYLLSKRVTEAKNLLAGTELSISDIAESVGFSSGSYFSQRFRLVTGMTPMEFRTHSHGGLC